MTKSEHGRLGHFLDRVLCHSTEGASFNSLAQRAGIDANQIVSPGRASLKGRIISPFQGLRRCLFVDPARCAGLPKNVLSGLQGIASGTRRIRLQVCQSCKFRFRTMTFLLMLLVLLLGAPRQTAGSQLPAPSPASSPTSGKRRLLTQPSVLVIQKRTSPARCRRILKAAIASRAYR